MKVVPRESKRKARDQIFLSSASYREEHSDSEENERSPKRAKKSRNTSTPTPRKHTQKTKSTVEPEQYTIDSDYDSDIEVQRYIEKRLKLDMQKMDKEFQAYTSDDNNIVLNDSSDNSDDVVVIDLTSPKPGSSSDQNGDADSTDVTVLDDTIPSNCNVQEQINNFESNLKEAKDLINDVNKWLEELTPEPDKEEVTSPHIKVPECAVCFVHLTNKKTRMSTKCGHLFCKSCIQKCIRTAHKCPLCRTKLSLKDIHPIYFE